MMKLLVLLVSVSFVAAELPTVELKWDRIIRGDDANEGEFPYMASLRKVGSVPGHTCGASILTDTWALTAAHCCSNIKNGTSFYVYVGSIYLNGSGTNHTVAKAVSHPSFNPSGNYVHDICVLKVAKPFKYSSRVAQITLGRKGFPVNDDDNVTITGWGQTDPNGNGQKDLPNRLQKGVDFSALTTQSCYFRTGFRLDESQICAEGRRWGQTTWNGDSGGPLVKKGVQVGLTSLGFRPYERHLPSVFTSTTHHIDWIRQVLGPDASKLKII